MINRQKKQLNWLWRIKSSWWWVSLGYYCIMEEVKVLIISKITIVFVTNKYMLQEIEFPTAGLESVPGSFFCFLILTFFSAPPSPSAVPFTYEARCILLSNIYIRRWWRRYRNDWKYAVDSWVLWHLHKSRESNKDQNSKLHILKQYSLFVSRTWLKNIKWTWRKLYNMIMWGAMPVVHAQNIWAYT